MLEPVCVIWSQVVSSSVLGGGKFRVIMQYMEPHCIVQELKDGWQGHGVLHRWVGIGGRLGGIWGYAAVCAITGEGGIILGRY